MKKLVVILFAFASYHAFAQSGEENYLQEEVQLLAFQAIQLY